MTRRDLCLGIGASLLLPRLAVGQTRGLRSAYPPRINWDWGPNRGLIWAVLIHPRLVRGTTLVDLVRQRNGAISGYLSPPSAAEGIAFTTSRRGGFGEARLVGSDELISFTDVQLPTGGAAYTAALWERATVSGASRYLWSYGTAASAQERSLQITAANVIRQGTFGGDVDGTTTVTDGQWYHVAGTIGPSTTSRVYVNGALNNSGTITAANTVLNGTMRIGWNPGFSVTFTGMLDDVRLWNRALAASEIEAVYQDSLHGYPQYLQQDVIASVRGAAKKGRARGRLF